jgi:hypothetical protein
MDVEWLRSTDMETIAEQVENITSVTQHEIQSDSFHLYNTKRRVWREWSNDKIFCLHGVLLRDLNEEGVGKHVARIGIVRNATKILVAKLNRKYRLRGLGVVGKIILKCTSVKYTVAGEADLVHCRIQERSIVNTQPQKWPFCWFSVLLLSYQVISPTMEWIT